MFEDAIVDDHKRLEYRFDLTVDDFQSLTTYTRSHLPNGKRWPYLTFVRLVLCTLILVPLACVFTIRRPIDPRGLIVFGSFILIVTALVAFALFVRLRRLRSLADSLDSKDLTFVIAIDGIASNGHDFASHSHDAPPVVEWSKVYRLIIASDHLYFQDSGGLFHILPRRAIGNAERVNRLLTAVRNWYSGPVIDDDGRIVPLGRAEDSVDRDFTPILERLEYRFDLSTDDFAVMGYHRTHHADGTSHSYYEKFSNAFIIALFFVYLAVSVWLIFERPIIQTRDQPSRREEAIPYAVAWINLAVAVLISGLLIWMQCRVRKACRAFASNPAHKNRRCVITPEFVWFAGDRTMVEYRWLYIERIVVLKTHLLFCGPDFQLEPVPRKAIGDGDDVVRLLARIRRWYPGPIMDGDGKILTPTEALLNV